MSEHTDAMNRIFASAEVLKRAMGEGMKNMTFTPIKDHTFKDLPEIRHLFPCGLDIKTCKREDTGEVFQIGRILTGPATGTCLYPAGNEFAKATCEVVFK